VLLCGYKSTVKLLFIPVDRGVGIDASAHTTVVDVVEDVVDVVDEVVEDVVDVVDEGDLEAEVDPDTEDDDDGDLEADVEGVEEDDAETLDVPVTDRIAEMLIEGVFEAVALVREETVAFADREFVGEGLDDGLLLITADLEGVDEGVGLVLEEEVADEV
jgi:hypothetical protein